MNQDAKAKWIAALRSGEFTQITDWLKVVPPTGDSALHCALGVLCEVAVREGIAIEIPNLAPGAKELGVRLFTGISATERGTSAFPARPIMDWAELTTAEMLTVDFYNLEHNFYDVADWIEEHL